MKKKTSSLTVGRFIIVGVYVVLFALFIHGLKPKTHNNNNNNPDVLHIFGWPEQFLPSTIKRFTDETGIEVKTHLYLSNEELLTKMRRMKEADYDILIPSDYAVKSLIKEGMLQPIDHSKLDFYNNFIPGLLNLNYDPGNKYSLPYQWEVFGFGVDKNYFKDYSSLSWETLFSIHDTGLKISMVDDPIEAIQMSAFYQYGPNNSMKLTHKQTQSILHTLKQQKKNVEAYTNMKPDYLLATKNCQLAVSSSAWILRSIEDNPHVEFVIPQDWSFISIENMCIHKDSKKQKAIYAFLNFIYQDQVMARDCGTFLNFPSITTALPLMENPHPKYVRCFNQAAKKLSFFYFITPLLSEQETTKLWVDLKT
ncbi:hypothetical protein COB21_01425 [Candidatus Aerophobetes bacterium]|uniref:Spermidine/putrescine ABC transporter substrate-binding protein n=1 Tax=Aerophobetes bacterium TaxID=2030807 RepID=A0A2A4X6M2_UNCAE|nr:MAG: hypothetical protein COB21_01425 [Candidatus Aerophobetes bacterium]